LLDAAYYHLDERDAPERPTRDRALDTVSLRVIRAAAPGAFDYELEGMHQWGSVRDGLAANAARLEVSALFAHADAGYTFDAPWRPRLSLEFDYASGEEAGGAFTRFDTLFGMRRADLAPAGIYAALSRANIVTPALRLELVPSPRFDAFMALRGMWLASATDSFSGTGIRDASGASGHFAGYQWEGRARYWLFPDALLFEADAVLLFKGRFLETAPNVVTSDNTRYLSFNLSAFF
jgi:hypothetical protein